MSIFDYKRIRIAVLIERSNHVEAWQLTISLLLLGCWLSMALGQVDQLVHWVDGLVIGTVVMGLVGLIRLEGRLSWAIC